MSLAKVGINICLLCISLLLTEARQSLAGQRNPTQLNQPQELKQQWHELKDPSGDFALLFPKEPIHQRVKRGDDLVEEYTLEYDGCLFSFEYFNLGEQMTEDGYRRVRNYRQAQTIRIHIQDGWHLLRQKLLSSNGYEMDWTVPTNGTMSYMRRQEFYRSSRAYAIGFYSYDSEDLDSKLADRFFSSLHFKNSGAADPGKIEE